MVLIIVLGKVKFLQIIRCIPVCHQWSRHGTWNRSRTQWSVSWSQCSPARNMYRKLNKTNHINHIWNIWITTVSLEW